MPLTRKSQKNDMKALASNMYSNDVDDTESKAKDAVVWCLEELQKNYYTIYEIFHKDFLWKI